MADVFEIIEFLKEKTGADEITESSDVGNDLGVDGDDYIELLAEFSEKYNVDTTPCLWYFHYSEEGSWNSLGNLFFKSPDKRVEYIPITPTMLAGFTRAGKWNVQYPAHKIPARRYDILFNQFIIFAVIVFVLYKCAS